MKTMFLFQQKQVPLVGDKLPFIMLAVEYDNDSSDPFFKKTTELAETYSDIRQIRGDGNCFYRAIQVGLLEIMIKDQERLEKFIGVCKEWIIQLVKLGFPDWTTSDFGEFFIEFLVGIKEGTIDENKLFNDFNDDSTANYLLMFLRLITSGYLKLHSEEYAPFIDEGLSVAQYCETEIEAMWKDADHLAIMALVKAADTRVRIEYMDRTAAPNGGWHYDIPSEVPIEPEITLLYRPGHYDLIYKKSSVDQ